MSSIETKALCSILRKAEEKGERPLVEAMIEICDAQSGLRFEDLWDWWKSHKQKDALKNILPGFQQYPKHPSIPFNMPKDPFIYDPSKPLGPSNNYEIIC